jgi:protein AFG1
MVAQGRLAWDEEQVRVVMKVNRIWPTLAVKSCRKRSEAEDRELTRQLRHLLDELADYEPPLDLLAKLPSSPFSQSRRRARWWTDRKGKEKEWLSSLTGLQGEEGKELVRVLTGEEELEGLTTPKVSPATLSTTVISNKAESCRVS